MTTKNRIILERLIGQLEGLAFGVKNKGISGGLFDIAEAEVRVDERMQTLVLRILSKM